MGSNPTDCSLCGLGLIGHDASSKKQNQCVLEKKKHGAFVYMVRTPDSQSGKTGSNPVGTTIWRIRLGASDAGPSIRKHGFDSHMRYHMAPSSKRAGRQPVTLVIRVRVP